MNLPDSIAEGFNTLQSQHKENNLAPVRQKAFEAYTRMGIPSLRHEEWKYTRLSAVLNKEYSLNFDPATPLLTRSNIEAVRLPGASDSNELVFVNGVFHSSLSNIISKDIIAVPLDEAAASEHAALVETHLNHSSRYLKDGMQALNTAFSANGVFVLVKKHAVIEEPVYIYHLTDTTNNSVFVQPRSLFIISENAQVQLVERYVNNGSNDCFTNEVIEIVVKENARLEYYKIQDQPAHCHHVGTTHLQQVGKSFTHAVTITLGGGTIRNNMNMILDAEYNEGHLYGLYMLDGDTHADNHTIVDNVQPNCYSNEFYKGIMDGKSTGVFNGKIFVRKDAQKTNAYQSNKNVLVSDFASVNAKPQLEIFADDVKCSHGCTVGRLDEEALFYLRSRGIDKEKAQAFLLHAFAVDILDQVKPQALRNYVEKQIDERLEFSAL